MRSGLVWIAAVAAAPVDALAGTAAVVDAVLVADAKGSGWHATVSGADAQVVRDGVTSPLQPGQTLLDGDVVKTGAAQVRLRVVGDEQVIVGDHAEVELGPRTWIQRVGALFYRVHGVFKVQYASVEAAVDGTRFVVAPDRVDVLGGVVHVTGPGFDEQIPRGDGVALADGAPWGGVMPVVGPSADADRQLVRRLGPPRFAVLLDVGGGLFGKGGASTGRLGGRWMVGRTIELFADAGITGDGKRFHIPLDLGLAARFGWLRVGIGPQLRIGQLCDEDCNKAVRLVSGGMGLVGGTIPLGGRVNLELTLRGGWAVSPNLDGAVGLSFGL